MRKFVIFAALAAGLVGLCGVASAAQESGGAPYMSPVVAQTPPAVIGQNAPVFGDRGVVITTQLPAAVIGHQPNFGTSIGHVISQGTPAVIGQSYAG